MPYEQWKKLSPHGQRISRYVVCGKGETVIGAGYIHPRAKMREAFRAEQLAELGAEAAEEYLRPAVAPARPLRCCRRGR